MIIMNLEEFVNLFYSKTTSMHGGIVEIKDHKIQLQGELKIEPSGMPVIMVNISINKTNVGLTAVYLVDLNKDPEEKVVADIETLVSFMHFGVDKVAKAVVIQENTD